MTIHLPSAERRIDLPSTERRVDLPSAELRVEIHQLCQYGCQVFRVRVIDNGKVSDRTFWSLAGARTFVKRVYPGAGFSP